MHSRTCTHALTRNTHLRTPHPLHSLIPAAGFFTHDPVANAMVPAMAYRNTERPFASSHGWMMVDSDDNIMYETHTHRERHARKRPHVHKQTHTLHLLTIAVWCMQMHFSSLYGVLTSAFALSLDSFPKRICHFTCGCATKAGSNLGCSSLTALCCRYVLIECAVFELCVLYVWYVCVVCVCMCVR